MFGFWVTPKQTVYWRSNLTAPERFLKLFGMKLIHIVYLKEFQSINDTFLILLPDLFYPRNKWFWLAVMTTGRWGFCSPPLFQFFRSIVNALEWFPLVAEDLNTAGGSIPLYPVNIPAILDKLNEKLRPPLLPFQWWIKRCVLAVARVHRWFGGTLVLFLILFCPRL